VDADDDDDDGGDDDGKVRMEEEGMLLQWVGMEMVLVTDHRQLRCTLFISVLFLFFSSSNMHLDVRESG